MSTLHVEPQHEPPCLGISTAQQLGIRFDGVFQCGPVPFLIPVVGADEGKGRVALQSKHQNAHGNVLGMTQKMPEMLE